MIGKLLYWLIRYLFRDGQGVSDVEAPIEQAPVAAPVEEAPVEEGPRWPAIAKTHYGTKAAAIAVNELERLNVEYEFALGEIAYILETVNWECRFIPRMEKRAGRSQEWLRKLQARYWGTGFMGRGYAQITWKDNYRKFSPVVGADLVEYPDMANRPDIGMHIVCHGFKHGWFRSRSGRPYKISDFVGPDERDYKNARDCWNGDKNRVLNPEAPKEEQITVGGKIAEMAETLYQKFIE